MQARLRSPMAIWLCLAGIVSAGQQGSPKERARALELNNLAAESDQHGRLAAAEQRYLEALQVWENSTDPGDPGIIVTLNGLGNLRRIQGQNSEAQRLFQRAIAIGETAGESARLDLAFSLNSLGALYCDENKPSRA